MPKNTPIPPKRQQYILDNASQFQEGPETSRSFAEMQRVQSPINYAIENASMISEPAKGRISCQCPECGRQLGSNSALRQHYMRFHSAESPYVCNVCFQKCGSNSALIVHMRIHTRERPFICNVCSKGFSRNDYYRIHMRSHTGEKPYNCEFCNRNFTQSGNMKVHKKIHNRQVAVG